MNLNLENKTALVCGASQGLGLAIAKELALLGATVIIASRTKEKLDYAVKQLAINSGQQHAILVIDLMKPEEVKNIVQDWMLKFGVIQILINNAGGPPAMALIDTPVAELQNAFDAHVISSHLLAQLLVPGMKQSSYGRIINVVSTSVKQPINGLGISNTIRAAMANWAKTLANEIGHHGITVNNVLPGFTNTDRLKYLFAKQAEAQGVKEDVIEKQTIDTIPAKRLGEASEFGAVVAFLCTPAAAYINGVNLPVDGGRTGTL